VDWVKWRSTGRGQKSTRRTRGLLNLLEVNRKELRTKQSFARIEGQEGEMEAKQEDWRPSRRIEGYLQQDRGFS
jgi:hypothetical protein